MRQLMLFILFISILLPLDNQSIQAQSDTLIDIIQNADINIPTAPNNLESIQADNLENIRLLSILPPLHCYIYDYCPVGDNGRKLLLREDDLPTIYDLTDFSVINQIETPTDASSIRLSHTAQFLAYAQGENIHIYNIVEETTKITSVKGDIRDIGFTPDDSKLIIITYQEIAVYDTEHVTRQFIFDSDATLLVRFNNDILITYHVNGGNIQVYQLTDGTLPKIIENSVYIRHAIIIDPYSQWLAAASGNFILYWNLTDDDPVMRGIKTSDSPFTLIFSPIKDLLLTRSENEFHVWNLAHGEQLASYPASLGNGYNISPDGRFVALTAPIRIVDLMTKQMTVVPGNYVGWAVMFDPTGSTLIVDTRRTIMIFGIPSDTRPMWESVSARVIPSGISVRAEPYQGADIIGMASGEVIISARSSDSEAVYLPAYRGWVWSNPSFLDIDNDVLSELPVGFEGILDD